MTPFFKKIDIKNHSRSEYLSYFTKDVPCTFSLCVDIDITIIKRSSFKLYPVMIFLITKVANEIENFRMSFDKEGNFGIYEYVNPSYTILNDDKSFSSIYTKITDDFLIFYQNILSDMKKYQNKSSMLPQKNMPKNLLNISTLPWINFTSFNLNLQNGYNYLLPIFTIGKFIKKDGNYMMPLSIQAHHGTSDGYHVGLFLKKLNDEIEGFNFDSIL